MFFRSKKSESDLLKEQIGTFCLQYFSLSQSALDEKVAIAVRPPMDKGTASDAQGGDDLATNAGFKVTIHLGFVCKAAHEDIKNALVTYLAGSKKASELDAGDISIAPNVPVFETKTPPLKNVKNIIAVSSGKGGVGKSSTAVNLSLALKTQGARVGILDADIYGPSVPMMLNTEDASPESPDNKHMFPIEAHGLMSNSIGYLVKNDHASIWRGPMASKALTQLAKETMWPLLDYLIVDMPPGTGDIQLTMAQQLPLTAAIVVTTPQNIALSDAEKGIAMFNKLDLPVLGLIENMSYFECPKCQHVSHIFAQDGAQTLSEKYGVSLLAQVPLNPILREYSDNGRSLIDEQPEHELSLCYVRAAQAMSLALCEQVPVSALAKELGVNAGAGNIDVTQL